MYGNMKIELTEDQRRAVSAAFEGNRDVLVELNFHGFPVAADYHLLDDEDDMLALLEKQDRPVQVRMIPAAEIGTVDEEQWVILK